MNIQMRQMLLDNTAGLGSGLYDIGSALNAQRRGAIVCQHGTASALLIVAFNAAGWGACRRHAGIGGSAVHSWQCDDSQPGVRVQRNGAEEAHGHQCTFAGALTQAESWPAARIETEVPKALKSPNPRFGAENRSIAVSGTQRTSSECWDVFTCVIASLTPLLLQESSLTGRPLLQNWFLYFFGALFNCIGLLLVVAVGGQPLNTMFQGLGKVPLPRIYRVVK